MRSVERQARKLCQLLGCAYGQEALPHLLGTGAVVLSPPQVREIVQRLRRLAALQEMLDNPPPLARNPDVPPFRVLRTSQRLKCAGGGP